MKTVRCLPDNARASVCAHAYTLSVVRAERHLSLVAHQSNRPSLDEARLLPRLRPDGAFVQQSRRLHAQAQVLADTVEDTDTRPLRHELTKPGDPLALRGIPAIGRSVSGAIPDTNPEQETIRRLTRADRIRERTELDAA